MSAPTHLTITEGSPAWIAGRVVDTANAALTQTDFDGTGTITYKVFDLSGDTPSTATQSGTLTYTDVISSTLQTSDSRWDVDSTGYNFDYVCPATWFPDGGHTYAVEVLFTDDDAYTYPAEWIITTRERRGD